MFDTLFLIADSTIQFCARTSSVWKLVGRVLFVFKIVIPILLIIFGMMDLGKAVVAAKDDEIKTSTKKLAMRAIAGIVIFFVPTIVGFIFTIVEGFTADVSKDYKTCKTCIVSPSKCPAQVE